MAITIRNKQTEAMIREIGRRRGEGPSAVVRWLAERELGPESGRASQEEYERAMEVFDELDQKYPPPSDEEIAEMRREMETMYDYLDEEAARLKRQTVQGGNDPDCD